MRVLIEYTQTGKYRDHAWEALTIRSKGEIQAVTLLCGAAHRTEPRQLIDY